MEESMGRWPRAGKVAMALVASALAGCVGVEGDEGQMTAGGEGDPGSATGGSVLPSGFYIDPYKSVLIRQVGVVDDDTRTQDPCTSGNDISRKYWSFGYLMTQMANTTDYNGFARSWLSSWETTTSLNGDSLAEVRPTDPLIAGMKPIATRAREAWTRASGSSTLAMSKAPFRLLAIVNRFDLRKDKQRFGVGNLSNSGNAGELRFVFSVLDLDNGCAEYSTPNNNSFRGQELVILEYAVNLSTADARRNWITSWTDLTNYEPGTFEFNSRLQNLTQQVVAKGKGGTRPNGSALIRIRTNETANAVRWDMREFTINGSTHLVVPATVKLTPRDSLNCVLNNSTTCSNDLAHWMRDHGNEILADTYVVPDQFPSGYSSRYFLGAHSSNAVANTYWVGGSGYTVPPDVRHQFSKGTCSGCHSAETGTGFFHIQGREKGDVAKLSPFLTGYECGGSMLGCGAEIYGNPHCVDDPVSHQQRCFGEVDRRVEDILSFLNTGV